MGNIMSGIANMPLFLSCQLGYTHPPKVKKRLSGIYIY